MSKEITNKTIILFTIFGSFLAIISAVLIVFFISPMIQEKNSQEDLSTFTVGKVLPINTSTIKYKSKSVISSTNTSQKALGVNKKTTVPPAFIFSNGKNTKKTMDVYIDFSAQRSRDFILMNQTNLKKMIQSGYITLKVHPIANDSAYSLYAPEALAESFSLKSNKSWDLLIKLLQNSATLDTNQNDEIVKSIIDNTKDLGLTDINKDSIKNGTFSSWILSGSTVSILQNQTMPVVVINNKIVNQDKVDINDSTAFQKYVLGE